MAGSLELRRYRTLDEKIPLSHWLDRLDLKVSGRVEASKKEIFRMQKNLPKIIGGEKMKKKNPYVSHEEEQLHAFRKKPKRAIEYLNACLEVSFEENDPELFLTALATVGKAYGMTRLAKKAHLKRESLHRMLSKNGNPEWNSIFKIFKALQFLPKLQYEALAA